HDHAEGEEDEASDREAQHGSLLGKGAMPTIPTLYHGGGHVAITPEKSPLSSHVSAGGPMYSKGQWPAFINPVQESASGYQPVVQVDGHGHPHKYRQKYGSRSRPVPSRASAHANNPLSVQKSPARALQHLHRASTRLTALYLRLSSA